MQKLRRRKVIDDMTCSCYVLGPEDTAYVLFSRTFAGLVWVLSGLLVLAIATYESGGFTWLRNIYRAVVSQAFALFLTIFWGLWVRNNMHIFERQQLKCMRWWQ
ncbi:hypothetical protein Salat_2668100 [Sesamum alatum]|uniref:Uncharacterized protein n=1 Tax=Sesamum alatum TaxID=300844 RepID=A0AAE2CB36_9LAMI|nr:hypothetical protein Salat_2668100 [Sesamum alatum]